MQHTVHLDFETRSPTDLKTSGIYRYVEDAHTGVWCFKYRISGGPMRRWREGDPDPVDLLEHIARGGRFTCHNAAFERNVWNYVMRRWFPHWPIITIEQQDCTMARAAAVGHPQKLEQLCDVLDTQHKKDMAGSAIMLKMAKPRSYDRDGNPIWWNEQGQLDRLEEYCEIDVLTEEDADSMLPLLTDYERRVWILDQKINERGIPIDMPIIPKCVSLVDLAKKAADSEMRQITGRVVPRCTSDNKLIEWIQGRGIDCTTVKKGVQDDLLFMAGLSNDRLVCDAIKLRGEAKKTSTAKYAAVMKCANADGRVRGLLNYHGAGPGRWAGRLLQPQNFPRVDKKDLPTFNWLAEMLLQYSPQEVFDMLVLVHGAGGKNSPLRLMSRFLRSIIKAPPGKKFIGGDFANIEGRVNAFLAGEMWKLAAFRDYDNGVGPDLYKLAYSKSFGVDIESIEDGQRQIGKVQELALGYQGGVGAYIDMGDTYGVNPYDLSGPIQLATSARDWDAVASKYSEASDKQGLHEREWTAITLIVKGWRAANPAIVQSWWDLQDAAIEAVDAPGTIVPVLNGRVRYYSDGRCLWCVLPSNRMIAYPSPSIEKEVQTYIDKNGEVRERVRRKVSYWGVKEGSWRKLYLYGGKQCENIVQGTARCVMVDRMFAVEERGYPIILTVHDELLAEVDAHNSALNDREFEKIMTEVPAFVAGMPLAAKAWEDTRYVK